MKSGKHGKQLITRRDVVLILVESAVTFLVTFAAGLLVMVVQHALY